MLKQEVSSLKEASMWDTPGPGHQGYVKPEPQSAHDRALGRDRDPIDPKDVLANINDLIKRVEALEDRPRYFKPRNPRHVGRS
jgi:hypothetical protein